MGTFQSKKKYDVATGESSIKGGSDSSRSDRKRDHKSRVSQVTLNKLSVQQSEVDQSVNENEDSNHYSKIENESATLPKAANNLHGDIEPELKHPGNETKLNDLLSETDKKEKQDVNINKNLHLEIDKQQELDSPKSPTSSTLVLEDIVETKQDDFVTNRETQDDKQTEKVAESDTKVYEDLAKSNKTGLPPDGELRTNLVEEWLHENQVSLRQDVCSAKLNETSNVDEQLAESNVKEVKHEETFSKTPQADREVVGGTEQNTKHEEDMSKAYGVDGHLVVEDSTHEVTFSKTFQVDEQAAGGIVHDAKHEKAFGEQVPDDIAQDAKHEEAFSKTPQITEHANGSIVQDPKHEASQAHQVSEQEAVRIEDVEKAAFKASELNAKGTDVVQDEIHEKAVSKSPQLDENVPSDIVQEVKHEDTCENIRHVVFGSDSDTEGVRSGYCINEAFIREEKKAALDSVGFTKCEENEQEAITVLNNVIKEAVSSSSHHIPETHTEIYVVTETCSLEPSRKRPIIGDHPSVEEISESIEKKDAKEVKLQTNESQIDDKQSSPNEEISTVKEEVHGILVSDSHCSTNKEGNVVSHIYLENFGSDDVHYTLDKLQLMEGQIKSTRTRILSIKEID